MKTLALLVLLLFPTVALSNTLEFAWDYDPAIQIEGFRLYEDGKERMLIGNEARTVQVPQLQDRISHTYYLTAYDGAEESKPSEFALVPAYYLGVPAVLEGTFKVRIIVEE